MGTFLSPVFTFFYRGTDYWKFDNQRLAVEPGYPRSILRDWMGCRSQLEGHHGDRQPDLDDVDVRVPAEDVPPAVNAVAVVIPCVLSLCLLVLLYTVLQSQHKGAPPSASAKRCPPPPLQEWV